MQLRVPFEKQPLEYVCGPTCLHMVLRYHDVHVVIAALVKKARTSEEYGTQRRAMADVMRLYGFTVGVKQHATLRHIADALKDGLPVIVNYRDFEAGDGHYGVVVGLDASFIYLHDPLLHPAVKVSRADFVKRWFGSRKRESTHWMMVCREK